MIRWKCASIAVIAVFCVVWAAQGEEDAAARGKKALLEKSYNPPTMTMAAFEDAWKHWGLERKPAAGDYDRLFHERYGLHPAPYPNDGLPMGLRKGYTLIGRKGFSNDCLICHGGSIFGTSYVGLGNSSLDFQTFYEELNASYPRRATPPFRFANVRGTNEAGAMAVFLLGYREPDLTLRFIRRDLDLQDDLCEDVPAWWLLKKKKTMYYTGGADTRDVRSLMQFMMSPLNLPASIHKAEADFTNIRAFLMSIQPPKYPLPIDRKLADKGEMVFKDHCARCHGTYGAKWTYPNKFVPIDEIGTDRRRFDGISRRFGEYYNKSWFAAVYKAIDNDGYQAPPLDGIWATAPYLHNGSVPTVYNLLNSKTRPKLYTRSYHTGREDYDSRKLGWKVQILEQAPDPKKTPGNELRKVYDTTRPGRSNAGHTFGDKLAADERMAVIEYLKTL